MDAVQLVLILAGVAAVAAAVILISKKKSSTPTPVPTPVPTATVDPVIPSPSLTLSTYNVLAQKNVAGTALVTSDAVRAIPQGGFSPQRYEWKQVSGDTEVTIRSQIGDTTTFSRTIDDGQTIVAVFQCTGTDYLGAVISSTPVVITFKG